MNFLFLLKGPWHWAISGFFIGLVMLGLIYFGKNLGLSDTYRTLCVLPGGNKLNSILGPNIKGRKWNLLFALGIIVGSSFTSLFLMEPNPIKLSPSMVNHLNTLSLLNPNPPNHNFPILPDEIFSLQALSKPKNLAIILLGAFLSGFGARYAGGCTSGHFVSGLSNLQFPSLITFGFFFLGGLITSHILIPFFYS